MIFVIKKLFLLMFWNLFGLGLLISKNFGLWLGLD